MKRTKARHKTEPEEFKCNVLKKTAMRQLSEFLNLKNPDISSIKKEIANLRSVEEDQIKDAFKEGVIYGNGLLQTFDYPESRYYCFTYEYSKKD